MCSPDLPPGLAAIGQFSRGEVGRIVSAPSGGHYSAAEVRLASSLLLFAAASLRPGPAIDTVDIEDLDHKLAARVTAQVLTAQGTVDAIVLRLTPEAAGRLLAALRAAIQIRHCRICGCSDYDPCEGGCSWVDDSLCSRCADGLPVDPIGPPPARAA